MAFDAPDPDAQPTPIPFLRSAPISYCSYPQALTDHQRAAQNSADVTGRAQFIARPSSRSGPLQVDEFYMDGQGVRYAAHMVEPFDVPLTRWYVSERVDPNPAKLRAYGLARIEGVE